MTDDMITITHGETTMTHSKMGMNQCLDDSSTKADHDDGDNNDMVYSWDRGLRPSILW